MNFFSLFHRNAKKHRSIAGISVPVNPKDWPDSWRTTYYKIYGHAPRVPLPTDTTLTTLDEVLIKRKSKRDFNKTPLTLNKLGTLLKYACGETSVLETGQNRMRRSYPSAGARYPIEAYILVFQGSSDLPSGVYHYNVAEHSLEILKKLSLTPELIAQLFTYTWIQEASAVIVLTAIFLRTVEKYGDRGYRYLLLEAGHIGQNIYTTSNALNIKCCGLGGSRDEPLEEFLGIDGISESVVYSLAIGA